MAQPEECELGSGRLGPSGPTSPRLTEQMRSRKLQALDFIKRYFVEWGHSPTLGELAAGLGGISTKRAYDLVHQLAEDQMIERTYGKTRGIRLPDRGEELSEADVLLLLSSRGWIIGAGSRVILPPKNPEDAAIGAAIVQALTEKGLPPLDFIPDEDAGVDRSGGDDGRIEPRGSRGSSARAAGPG